VAVQASFSRAALGVATLCLCGRLSSHVARRQRELEVRMAVVATAAVILAA
jgi:hypothetical protein